MQRPARPGDRVDRYELVRLLGRGGFGQVWEAERDGGPRVALKLAPPGTGLHAEARLGARLRHRHLLDVLEAGETDGWAWSALELCPDGSLARFVPLPPRTVVDVGRGVCAALAFVHRELGLVHADVKPENLLVGADGEVRLADLGLAVEAHARRAVVAGTVGFASPEQRAGQPLTHASDVFSLGVTLAVLAGGHDVTVARTIALTEDDVPADLAARVPDWLEPLVDRCTRSDPALRPTAAEVDDALAALDAPGPTLAELVGRRRAAVSLAPMAGRAAELAAACALSDPTIVTGAVGIGKSRMLREVAGALQREGRDVVEVEGAPRSCTELLQVVAGLLGLPPEGGRDQLDEAVRAGLRRRDSVVSVDPCASDEVLGLLAAWHRDGIPTLAARRTRDVPPGWRPIHLELLGDEDGSALVKAAAARRGVVVGDREAAALARAYDGLPFALELVAGRLGVLSAAELAARPSVRDLRRSTDAERGALESALDGAWAELAEADRETLAAAAWFATSFSGDALEQVAGAGAAARLPELAARSVVIGEATGRWRLLEVVRSHTADRATATARSAYVAWALRASRTSELMDRAVWGLIRDDVRRDLPNLLPAVDLAREAGDLDAAVELVHAVGRLHREFPPLDAVVGPATRLAATPGLTEAQAMEVEERIVRAYLDTEHPEGIPRARALASRARAAGDPAREAAALLMSPADVGDLQRAAGLLPPGSVAWAHTRINEALLVRERDLALARELTAQAAAVYRARQLPRWLLVAELNSGLYAHLEGRVDDARRHYRAVLSSPSVPLATRVQCRSNLAILDLQGGRTEAAHHGLARALEEAEELGVSAEVAMVCGNLASAWLGYDDATAATYLERTLAEPRCRPGTRDGARLGIAHLRWRAGDEAGARALVAEILADAPDQVEARLLHRLFAPDGTRDDDPPPPDEPPPDDPGARGLVACLAWRARRYDDALRTAESLRLPSDVALFHHTRRRFPFRTD